MGLLCVDNLGEFILKLKQDSNFKKIKPNYLAN